MSRSYGVEFEQTLGSVEGGGTRYGVPGVAEQFQHARERTLIIFDDKDLRTAASWGHLPTTPRRPAQGLCQMPQHRRPLILLGTARFS